MVEVLRSSLLKLGSTELNKYPGLLDAMISDVVRKRNRLPVFAILKGSIYDASPATYVPMLAMNGGCNRALRLSPCFLI